MLRSRHENIIKFTLGVWGCEPFFEAEFDASLSSTQSVNESRLPNRLINSSPLWFGSLFTLVWTSQRRRNPSSARLPQCRYLLPPRTSRPCEVIKSDRDWTSDTRRRNNHHRISELRTGDDQSVGSCAAATKTHPTVTVPYFPTDRTSSYTRLHSSFQIVILGITSYKTSADSLRLCIVIAHPVAFLTFPHPQSSYSATQECV